ncbi:hypothetical protein ACFFJ7_05725 [Pseudochelatococcus lubricantis]|uniref:hypothetical protein n=1 Tax=Pseudochelatococcus lubricantis TaxID=1538102 RepID=UPI0035EAE494
MSSDRTLFEMFPSLPARRRGRRGTIVATTAIVAAKAEIRDFLDQTVPLCKMPDRGTLAAELLAAQRVLEAESEALQRGEGVHVEHGLDRIAVTIRSEGTAGEPIARRVAAFCLERGRPVPSPIRAFAAAAVRGDGAKPAKAGFRDTVIAETVNIALRHGINLTRSNDNAVSACSLVAELVGEKGLANVGEKAVETIWRNEKDRLT